MRKFSAYSLSGQMMTSSLMGGLTAQVPCTRPPLRNRFQQGLFRNGQTLLLRCASAMSQVSDAAYPKLSVIRSAIRALYSVHTQNEAALSLVPRIVSLIWLASTFARSGGTALPTCSNWDTRLP